MFFRRIKSEGLAHNSYFIGDKNEALVIDPRRDIEIYLEIARENEFNIKYILETHRNEDYAIGSTALQKYTDSKIFHSGKLDFKYGENVSDGDSFGIGSLKFKVIETPGHTDESLSFALCDTKSSSDPVIVFTGDALFVGDVGRTDLYGPDEKKRLSETLYESLTKKLLPLGDGVIICPGHGGGSVCGGNILERDLSSIGFERLNNPALKDTDKKKFVKAKMEEKHLKAPYFKLMEEWNRKGNAHIYDQLPSFPYLTTGEFSEQINKGAVVIDKRMPEAFAGGHIADSYNIWQEGLTQYLGWIADYKSKFLIVAPNGSKTEDITRSLLRIGFDNVAGFLKGGFESFQNEGKEIATHKTIDTFRLIEQIKTNKNIQVIDLRKPDECEEDSVKIFVGNLEKKIKEVPKDKTMVTMCSVGHRGAIAASILEKNGFNDIYNYLGGYTSWKKVNNEGK